MFIKIKKKIQAKTKSLTHFLFLSRTINLFDYNMFNLDKLFLFPLYVQIHYLFSQSICNLCNTLVFKI